MSLDPAPATILVVDDEPPLLRLVTLGAGAGAPVPVQGLDRGDI